MNRLACLIAPADEIIYLKQTLQLLGRDVTIFVFSVIVAVLVFFVAFTGVFHLT